MMDEETKKLIMEMMQNTEDTAMQARLAEILAMPPAEQEAAIADLTRAYEPERDDLRDELERNYEMLNAASPQGQVAGNNQFSRYVGANPLEHIASGINKYQAGKGMREGKDELKALADQQAKAQGAMMGAQASALSSALRANETPAQRAKRLWEEEQERRLYGSAST